MDRKLFLRRAKWAYDTLLTYCRTYRPQREECLLPNLEKSGVLTLQNLEDLAFVTLKGKGLTLVLPYDGKTNLGGYPSWLLSSDSGFKKGNRTFGFGMVIDSNQRVVREAVEGRFREDIDTAEKQIKNTRWATLVTKLFLHEMVHACFHAEDLRDLSHVYHGTSSREQEEDAWVTAFLLLSVAVGDRAWDLRSNYGVDHGAGLF